MIVEARVATLFAVYHQRHSQVVVPMAVRCVDCKTAPFASFGASLADLEIDWEASRRGGLVRATIVLRRRH
jgi:hypothetical protein